MQVTTTARSVASDARRRQIVAATVRVVARVGYRQASFARIAAEAGLSSTRLISYHFDGKDELVAAVVDDVITSLGTWVGDRVVAQTTAAGMLRAYVEGVVTFTAGHRDEMLALLDIVLAGAVSAAAAGADAAPSHVEAILRQGQASGEFRDFDPRVMALVVQRGVEALPPALRTDPRLDCAAFGRELVTAFDLATRRVPS